MATGGCTHDASPKTDPFWGLIQTDAETMERQIQEAAKQEVFNSNFAEGKICSSVSHQGIKDKKCCGTKPVETKPAEAKKQRSSRSKEKKTSRNSQKNKKSQQKSKKEKPDIVGDVESPTRNSITQSRTQERAQTNKVSSAKQNKTVDAKKKEKRIPKTETAPKEAGERQISSTTAKVRFQWAKTLSTETDVVVLKAARFDTPIELNWHPDHKVYESQEIDVPCGSLKCVLDVDGRTHQVEALDVKYYTFQVDVYLVEEETDRADPEPKGPPHKPKAADHKTSSPSLDPGPTPGVHPGSIQSKQAKGQPQAHPDIANMDDFQDTENELDISTDSGSIVHSKMLENLLRKQLAKSDSNLANNNNVVDGTTSLMKSDNSSHSLRSLPVDRKKEYIMESSSRDRGNRLYHSQEFPPVANGSYNHRSNSRNTGSESEFQSVNSSEVELSRYLDAQSGRRSVESGRRSVDHLSDIGQSPSYRTHRDADNSERKWHNPEDGDHYRLSSRSLDNTRSSDHEHPCGNGARRSTDLVNNGVVDYTDHRHGSSRSLDYNDNNADRKKNWERYSDLDYRGSGSGSRSSSRQGSTSPLPRRRSPHSWAEDPDGLDQRYGNPSRSLQKTPERRSPPVRRRLYNQDTTDYTDRGRDQEDGEEDLTPVSSPPRTPEQRSSTPNTNLQQQQQHLEPLQQQRPAMKAPLITSRTTPVSSSRSSSRMSEVPDIHRVHDLEDTILSLKRVLNERDREVDELKATNRAIEGDLHQLMTSKKDLEQRLQGKHVVREEENLNKQPAVTTPVASQEQEQRIHQLITEKENMATEIWKLQQQLTAQQQQTQVTRATANQTEAQGERRHSTGGATNTTHIGDYQPGSPAVLQRKLDDLQAHAKDLEEAVESSSSKLSQAETEVTSLKEENEKLRRALGGHDLQGLEQENRVLREQLERLTEDHTRAMVRDDLGKGRDPGYLHQEIGQLREDLRLLRDKNHQLVQDNIKLTEHLKDVDRRQDRGQHRGGSRDRRLRDDRHITESYREDSYSLERRETSSSLSREDGRQYYSVDEASRRRENPGREYTDPSNRQREDREPSPGGQRERRISDVSTSTAELTTASPTGNAQRKHAPYDYRMADVSSRYQARPTGVDRGAGSLRYSTDSKMPEFQDDQDEEFARLPKGRPPSERVDDVLDNLQHPPPPRGRYGADIIDDVVASDPAPSRQQGQGQGHQVKVAQHLQNGHRIPSIERDSTAVATIKSEEISDEFILHGNTGSIPNGSANVSFVTDDLSPPMNAGLYSDRGDQRGESFSSDKTLVSDELDHFGETGVSGRRDSTDSNSTEALLHEAEKEINHLSIRDTKGRTVQPSLSPSPPGTPCGLRSVSPKPIISQHNKHLYTEHAVRQSTNSFGHSSLTAGKRPFAPRSPADVQLGDIVKFSRQGGKISRGTVRYIGHLPGKNDTYLGVELEHEIGKHDGVYDNQRYFQSKPNKGVFVAFSKVVMVWGD